MLADTLEIGSHAYDYTYPRGRGLWFQAKSSFNIIGVKAGDGNHQGIKLFLIHIQYYSLLLMFHMHGYYAMHRLILGDIMVS
jgi:hypothetical protein